MHIDTTFTKLATQVAEHLLANKQMLATAESCTGGWVSQVLTSIAGSSEWFERGFVTYSNLAKQQMLGVSEQSLNQFGAVSEQVAREMAEGALKRSIADYALSITGIAGPSGGSVGTVWFAWGHKKQTSKTACQQFDGDRSLIRQQAVQYALSTLIDWMKQHG